MEVIMKFSKEEREYIDRELAKSDETQRRNGNKTYTLEHVASMLGIKRERDIKFENRIN